MALTRDEVADVLRAIDWEGLSGDPDDVAQVREGLLEWVTGTDPTSRDDARHTAAEVAGYVCEAEGALTALTPAVVALLDCPDLFDFAEGATELAGEGARHAKDPSEVAALAAALERFLAEEDPVVVGSLVALGAELAERVPLGAAWRAFLDAQVDGRTPGVALVALILAGGAEPHLLRLVERPGLGEELSAVVALGLRRLGRPLEGPARAFAAEHGQGGRLRAALARLGVSERVLNDLPPYAEVAVASALEPATVVFAGASLVQVRHESRGSFTLRIPGAGLSPGATVEIGDFVPPPTNRPLRARWAVDGRVEERRFAVDGQPL
jgi:hypothetical protein